MKRPLFSPILSVLMIIMTGVCADGAETEMGDEGSRSAANPTQRICVLNFERPEHGVTKVLSMVFSRYPETEIRNLATPKDLYECVRGGSEEIMIIAHALQSEEGTQSDLANLGYFRPADSNSNQYVVRPFLPRAMQRIREELRDQSRQGRLRLKRIRWMSCLPTAVFARYSDLKSAVEENSIEVDFAPKNEFLSLVSGQELVSLDLAWLTKSIDCFRLNEWQTERNSYCRADWWPGCDRRTAHACFPRGS